MKQDIQTGYPSIDKPWLNFYDMNKIENAIPSMTIYDYLVINNAKYPNNIALNYYNNKISYSKLFENIEKVAQSLTSLGVEKNSIVTILLPTLPETVYLFYALSKLGAISNMIDPRTSIEGINHYINEVKSDLLVVVDVAYAKISNVFKTTTTKKIIVVSPSDSLPSFIKPLYKLKNKYIISYSNRILAWKAFLQLENSAIPNYSYEPNHTVTIVHTGGTTGFPKGVMLTNDNLNAAAYQCSISGINMHRNHSWLNIMPPFIAYGVGNGLHLPLIIGMETILIPSFDPKNFDDLLIKYHPNHMVGVPSHYENIINSSKLKHEDLSYIIAPTVGGDTMDSSLEIRTNEFLKSHHCNDKVTKGYGMTEAAACVSVCISNECNQIGSVGVPLPHTVISIFDPETSQEMKYNELGEVCITGPNTMKGYYNNEKATQDILRTHDDGLTWIHSGDIGYMTEEGFLFIKDRIKRMIIRHDGFKIFPSLIETTIMQIDSVNNCCAIGINDKEHTQGKLPFVFIVCKSGYSEKKVINQIQEICSKELPEYAQPIGFKFINQLPLTPVGKIDFKKLENTFI
ncbi:class I adenylate-forming enzyme family protein [Holdemania massiliensis]|uniref:class I adenylate-forming enzyme family protein n=1 Tax=Holdemania massiliensis TaxID=1468449 RepID=UPI0002ED2E74|nr:class I adenylate-forming enzyme family protein [Holdemania massiliensis]